MLVQVLTCLNIYPAKLQMQAKTDTVLPPLADPKPVQCNRVIWLQVCVVHPKAPLQPLKKASMYKEGDHPGAEEYAQYVRYGYNADSLKEYNMAMVVQKRLGQVWLPWYEDMLQQAGLKGMSTAY